MGRKNIDNMSIDELLQESERLARKSEWLAWISIGCSAIAIVLNLLVW